MATADRVDLIMGGKIGNVDTWSTKFSFQIHGGIPSAADMNGIANGFATLFAVDFWDGSGGSGYKSLLRPDIDWHTCKTYYYPAGSTVATISGFKTITPDPGTAASGAVPPQCAVVFSYQTGLAGRRNRGRSYLPCVAALTSPGALTAAQALTIATSMRLFLHDTTTATVGALSFTPCVGTGSLPAITAVAVDTVIDTQRRRRNKQVSTGTAVVAL